MELPVEVVELMRKYGVGRRKLHDPFLEVKPPERLGVYNVEDESLSQDSVSISCSVPGCRHRTCTVQEQTRHYELAHRYMCSVCRQSLPTDHLLGLHVQETHDSFFTVLAIKRPSYCCYIEECHEKFWNAEERFNHGIEQHKLPKDFRLEQKINKKSHNKNNNKKKSKKCTETNEQKHLAEEPKSEDSLMSCDKNTEVASTDIKAPKNFTFGHNKHKAFPLNKFTSTDNKEKHIDMDVVVNDLKDSLPQ